MSTKEMKSVKGRKGVFFIEHPTRKNGVRKDRQFILRYTLGGKTFKGVYGWESAGFSEVDAEKKVIQFRENFKAKVRPISLQEERAALQEEEEAERLRKEQAKLKQVTFGEFFENTYLPNARQNKKPHSCLTEKGHFQNWLSPVIGDLPLQSITPFHLLKIKKSLQDEEKTPATIRYVFATFRQVWHMARRRGYVQTDSPSKSEDIKLPRINNQRQRFLTQLEADFLLEELRKRSERQYEIAVLSLHTGMRAGEIHKLTGDCLNFDNSTILIRNAKGDKDRHVYMTGEVKRILRKRSEEQGKDLIFTGRQGKEISEPSNTFGRVANELFNQGINDPLQKVTFHTLRHTFASWLVMDGTPLYTVQRLLGHSSIAITERYSHLAPNHLKEAAGRIEVILEKHNRQQVDG